MFAARELSLAAPAFARNGRSQHLVYQALTRAFGALAQVCDASNRKYGRRGLRRLGHPPSTYVTGLLVPRAGEIEVDLEVSCGAVPAQKLFVPRVGCAQGWVCPRLGR